MIRKAPSRIVLLIACAFAGACGGNPCEDALDKLTGECGLGSGVTIDFGKNAAECKDRNECVAKCVNDSSCDDITSLNSKYQTCVGECQSKPAP
jgi:hypothetical protein